MNKVKVTHVSSEMLWFDNGATLTSNHYQDCCERHYLSFEHLTLQDFEGLDFDLTNETFVRKIEGYGVELLPIHGHSVRVPGYGFNNGYYSTELTLYVEYEGKTVHAIDITDCQDIS